MYIMYAFISNKDTYNKLGDMCDSLLFKAHPIYSTDPLALQLIIYFDEVEVCNPLGHAHGVHKLGERLKVFAT